MEPLLKNVTNSIWHAFDFLSGNDCETVCKSKLKVLTANIGTILDLYGVEKGLDHYRNTVALNFQHFEFYLKNEVFNSVPNNIHFKESQELEEKIEEVCWLVCKKHYLQRENPKINDISVYHLFRIFCFLAELSSLPSSPDRYQVLLHSNEVERIVSEIASSLGLSWDSDDFKALNLTGSAFKFSVFLAFIEGRLGLEAELEALQEGISETYQTLLKDIIKKGNLRKRGHLLPTLKEYWFVLRTTELNYYKTPKETESCGCIILNPQARVGALPNLNKNRAHKIYIQSLNRKYELAALDHRTMLQWISAIRLAIIHSDEQESYQRIEAQRRKKQRDAGNQKFKDEVFKHIRQKKEIELTKEKLKREIKAREAANQKAKKLENSLEEQQKKAKKLMVIRNQLELLLKEETQSKRDEEIVRNLQARVLREEWKKREELEILQEEQSKMLEKERKKIVEFEKLQLEKERQLEDALARLKALEEEQKILNEELNLAQKKIILSEKCRQVLEAQIRIVNSQMRNRNELRRDASFVGTFYDYHSHDYDDIRKF